MMGSTQNAHKMPWHAHLLLAHPRRVQDKLAQLIRRGVIEQVPTLWQLELGVMRMWHRVVFRSNSIGTSTTHEVRSGWRARLLKNRLIRGPVLLLEGAIAPWDHTGLASSSKRLIKHLLAAHHDGAQFAYDLAILSAEPGALQALHAQTVRILTTEGRRTRWLKDLAVYDGYHEALLEAVECYLSGEPILDPGAAHDPDIAFEAYIDWCLRQPMTPRDSWRAWQAGRLGQITSLKDDKQ